MARPAEALNAGRDQDRYDVVVVGAGLVGLAFAAAAAREGIRVAIISRERIAAVDAAPEGEAESGANWDARVYAVSPGSATFLHRLGVWQRLPADRITAIETMDVRGDRGGAIEFSAYELGERALAWIVENRELNTALVETVRTAGDIDVIAPCQPIKLTWKSEPSTAPNATSSPVTSASASHVSVDLGAGRMLAARLIVGADGVRSWTRVQAGMQDQPVGYGQTAVVANFTVEISHRGRAFQWFIEDGGVLAWLPLPGRRISIVWSAPDALATELLGLDAHAFCARVGAAGEHALGALTLITAPLSFVLSSLRLPAIVGPRLALIGDAAHGVHPLAGQGVNLGFGDAAALLAVLKARGAVGDVGAPILLERYANQRSEPLWAMHTVTDGLARLFRAPSPWLRTLRNRGMRAVGAIAPLKRLLAQSALR